MARRIVIESPVYDEEFARYLHELIVERYNRGLSEYNPRLYYGDVEIEPHDSGYLVVIEHEYEQVEEWAAKLVVEIARELGFRARPA